MNGSTQPQTTPLAQEADSQEIYPEWDANLGDLLHLLRVRKYKYKHGGFSAEYVSDAAHVLRARGLRSFLTILSIFIGIAAVIVTLIWTAGISTSLNNQLINLGTNIISISSGSSVNDGINRPIKPLSSTDLNTLHTLNHVIGISPILQIPQTEVVYGRQNWQTDVVGVSEDFPTMQDWQLAAGIWFSQGNNTNHEPTAVLGATVAQQLTDAQGNSPLNQQIRIGSQLFHVSGVLAAKGGDFHQDDVVFVSFQTALIRLRNTTAIDQIDLQVDTINNIDLVQQAITTALRHNHQIAARDPNDFNTLTALSLIKSTQQQTQLINMLSISIAAISLFGAGLGIMNVMFVSVTERMREIGIRMAIGAHGLDIRTQFLIEALLICFIGGLFGLLFGLLIGWAVTTLTNLPFVVTPMILLLPFVISTGLAIIFGLYPAMRASRLDPIKAIRGAK